MLKLKMAQKTGRVGWVRGLKFEELINEAIAERIFDTPAKLTILYSLHSARVRRNFASHFSPYDRHGPNEQRATDAMSLMICFVDWLALGDDRVHEHQRQDPHASSARGIISAVATPEDLPKGESWASLLDLALSDVGPGGYLTLCEQAIRYKRVPIDELRRAIHRNFPALIRRVGPSRIRDVLELIGRLLALKMHSHAKVLSAMLPIDALTIEAVGGGERTLIIACTILRYARHSDSAMYVKLISNSDTVAALSRGLKERVHDGRFHSRDLATLLALLPRPVQMTLWRAGLGSALLVALNKKPLRAYAHLLSTLPWSLIRQDVGLRATHRMLAEALINRCRTAELQELLPVPREVADAVSLESSLCDAVAVVVLSRIAADASSVAESLIWEVANFAQTQQQAAGLAAAELVRNSSADRQTQIMAWSTAQLVGAISRCDWKPEDVEHIDSILVDRQRSVWSKLRIGYYAARHNSVTAEQRTLLLHLTATPSRLPLGKRLGEALEKLLSDSDLT